MKLVCFNIQKHGINGYLRKERQILPFGPAVKSVKFAYVKNLWFCICLHLLWQKAGLNTVCNTSAVPTTCMLCTNIFLECGFKIDFKLVFDCRTEQ